VKSEYGEDSGLDNFGGHFSNGHSTTNVTDLVNTVGQWHECITDSAGVTTCTGGKNMHGKQTTWDNQLNPGTSSTASAVVLP